MGVTPPTKTNGDFDASTLQSCNLLVKSPIYNCIRRFDEKFGLVQNSKCINHVSAN